MLKIFPFEKKVLLGLRSCDIDVASVSEKSPLGVAVSGGADSVSLLVSLNEIFGNQKLRVITVNHGIRSEEESGGDTQFVKNLCENLGVPCKIFAIPHGKILETAKSEKKSVEEVARNLRYEAFKSFIEEEHLCSLCLAHNQNDQTETLLMRFLQGSGPESLGGIEKKREKYIRPLLEIPRAEIEAYLRKKNQSWRTDSTNTDTSYLRNKIRNVLVPVLDEHFEGWQKAVLNGSKKVVADNEVIGFFYDVMKFNFVRNPLTSEILQYSEAFFKQPLAAKRRMFFKALNELGYGKRFPYHLFEKISEWKEGERHSISYENLKIYTKSKKLIIEPVSEYNTVIESGVSFLFKELGDTAQLGGFTIRAEKNDDEKIVLSFRDSSTDKELFSCKTLLPCVFRSVLPGDKIMVAKDTYKKAGDYLASQKISAEKRKNVFVIEEISLSGGENHILAFINLNPNL